jgi:serine/threonine protein kinase/tetratricopeptide (TPR) repeat protein
MTEAVATIQGRKLDARYTLLDKLGAGGQGEVWRAHDGTRGIDIALKVLNATAHQAEAWSTLEHEYAIASRLDHPSILKVFPPERSGEAMILPMELASGGDLRRLRGAGFLEIIPVLLEIAQALEHAHERGVVHRDLKPGNVLFDARGRARLADFGVAETSMMPAAESGAATAATRDTNRHGFSPFTASPAQLRGEPPTTADDIYGLGALAYELLSGYPPYYPHFDKKRAIEERVPTLVPTRQIPPLLGALVMHMLAKDPKRRPRTMREVIDELDAALNDTLTFDFENVPPSMPTAPISTTSLQAETSQDSPQAENAEASPAPANQFVWTPESQERRARPDRRGRRKEDTTPPSQREPTISSDLSDIEAAGSAPPSATDTGPGTRGSAAADNRPSESVSTRGSAAADNVSTGGAGAHGPNIASAGASGTRSPPRSGAEALARIDAALERAAAESAAQPKPAHSTPLTPAEAAAIVAAARAASKTTSQTNLPPTGQQASSVAPNSGPSAAASAPSTPSKSMWPREGNSTSASSVYPGQSRATTAPPSTADLSQTIPSQPRSPVPASTAPAASRATTAQPTPWYATPGQPTTTHWTTDQTAPWPPSQPRPPQAPAAGHPSAARPTPGHTASTQSAAGHAPSSQPATGHAASAQPTQSHATPGHTASSARSLWSHPSAAYAAGMQPAAAGYPPTVPLGTRIHAGPMHATWGEIPLDRLPKVARLEPIRPRRWPWVFLGLLAGGVAAVYFWLPRFDPQTLPPEVAAVVAPLKAALTPDASSTPTAPVVPASVGASSPETTQSALRSYPTAPPGTAAAPYAALAPPTTVPTSPSANTGAPAATPGDERRLREMRQTFDTRLAVLEARGAGVWGGREFATAKMRAAESVGAHDAGNPRVAQERLTAAMKLLDTVESKASQALSAQMAAGEKALGAGQQEVAGQAFDLARRINPTDRRASDGLRRAQNLNALLPLLADAQNAEAAHDYARAAQDYSQALFLDPGNATAKAGQVRANAAFGDDNYAKAVGSGFAALGAGRLDEAHDAFVKARALKPNGAEASEGLRRVGAALTARGFASMRQRAAGLEAQERWEEAERVYEDVLAADPSLAFAQEGKARTTSRADLSGRLQQFLDRPDRLASPGVREDVRALLETARAQSPQGPVIRSQIARLEILLPGFDKPVRLSLLSDNSTQVVISSIGSFGAFARRDIELRPGKYTVVGTRYGFRDVRREITVAPGQDAQTIRVTCSDPI